MLIKIIAAASALFTVLMTAGTATCADQDHPTLRIRIAVPERGMVAARDKHSHFNVVIENVSDQPQKIVDEWNSWGYFDLRLEYTLPNGETRRMEKQDRGWDKNFLTTTTLKPGEVTVWDVALDDSVWTNLPVPKTGEAKVTIRAIFSQKEGVADAWHGEVTSPDQEITFWSPN
jgi:hypothetical protein